MKLQRAPEIFVRLSLGLVFLSLAFGAATRAFAQGNVITPVSATASSQSNSATGASNLISSAGLLGTGSIFTQTVSNDASASNMWLSAVGTVSTNWVKFDLGYQYNLSGVALWQFNQPGFLGRGVKTLTVFTSPDLATPITNLVGTYTFFQGSGTTNESVQLLSISVSNVRQVMFTVSNVWSGGTTTNCGLSKVRFTGNSSSVSILQQPQGETTVIGAQLTLSVTPDGGPPYGYQWWKDTTNLLTGQTNASFTITNAQITNSGNYTVVVTNTAGGITSGVAPITIMDPAPLAPFVLTPVAGWASTTFSPANTVTNLFNSSGLSGVGPILSQYHDFQYSGYTMWTANNGVITNTWLMFDLGGQYDLTGAAIWQANHQNRPTRGWRSFGIFTSPDLVTPCTNYLGLFFLNEATGTTNTWVQLLSFNPAAAKGVRRVEFACSNIWELNVTNEYSEMSEVRFLGSASAITITQQPQPASRFVGDSVIFSVTTSGGPPFGWQWLHGTNLVAGATNASLSLTNLQPSDAGNYSVIVMTNASVGITSSPALLAVQSITDLTSGLIGYWKLDDASGITAADSSTSADNGTVCNVPGDNSQWIAGEIGGAMAFFGPNLGSNYIIAPNYPKPQSSMSFSAWVWADGANPVLNNSQIAGNWGSGTNQGQFLLGLGAAGQLQVTLNEATVLLATTNAGWQAQTNGLFPVTPYTPQISLQEGIPLPTNSWQHVAFVADGTRLHLYRNSLEVAAVNYADATTIPVYDNNGVQSGATNFTGTLLAPAIASLGFGARTTDAGTSATNHFWQGRMDDLAIWSRALAATEITAIYSAGTNGQNIVQVPAYPNTKPFILLQPQGHTNFVTDPVNFSVQCSGTQPFSYQWRQGGNPLSNATNSTLAFASLVASNAGDYTVVITNLGGAVTSSVATLTLLSPAATTNDFSGGGGLTAYSTKTWGTYPVTNNVTSGGTLQLATGANSQNCSVAFDRTACSSGHIVAQWMMSCSTGRLSSAFTLLNTAAYGSTGNPFSSLSAPPWSGDLWLFTNSLTVAFHVYDPNSSPTSTDEVALFWNDQQRVIVQSPYDYRQGLTMVPVKAEITFVPGGANVSVWLNTTTQIFTNYFIAGPTPYECRPAFEAATSTTAPFTNRVSNLNVSYDTPGATYPLSQVAHVFTNAFSYDQNGLFTNYVDLPTNGQSFGRIILAYKLAAPPLGIDAWDRIADLFVYDDSGAQYQILELITGYSVQRTWYIDVTDYQSLLRGSHRQFILNLGTVVPDGTPADGYGFLSSVDLYYYPGQPALTPYKVQNLWNGPNQNSYGVEYGVTTPTWSGAVTMQAFFVPLTAGIDSGAQSVKWKSMVTGHGESPNTSNAAEFFQSWRLLGVNSTTYSNANWKADNFLNATGAQSGTWKTSRSGWGPGAVVNDNGTGGWNQDITAAVTPGQNATFTYAAKPYTNTTPNVGNAARYVVTSQLISYRSPLLVPTVVSNSGTVNLSASATCDAILPDLTVSNFVVQDDISFVTVTQDPPAGRVLPTGTTLVTFTAVDGLGLNPTNGSLNVIVSDTTPPNITQCPPTQYLLAGAALPDLTSLLVASDNCSSTLNFVQQPPAGTILSPGVTNVTFYVDDTHGNTNTCATTVMALAAPSLAGGPLAGGGFQLTFSGPNGQTYRVVTSTDLTTPLAGWTTLTNGTFGSGSVIFTDTATNYPDRFYRVISP